MITRSRQPVLAAPPGWRPVAPHVLAYAALATAGALWGTSFLLGKIALLEVRPATLILYRFLLASAVLLPLALRAEGRLTRRDVRDLALAALLMGPFMFWLQFEGLARTTASSAALLVGIAPPLLAIGALVVDGERPGRRTWAAIAVSVAGTLLLVGSPAGGRSLAGDLMVVASMGAAVAWTLVSRRLARRLGVMRATAYQFALGALWLAPLALLAEGPPNLALSGTAWAAIAALGLGCTALTFWLWNWGLLRAQAAKAGVFANLEPVVGATLGVVVLGEVLAPAGLAGGALVLGAAVLISTGGRR
jgi:drug/metabolite transporter (DMT)-like permease